MFYVRKKQWFTGVLWTFVVPSESAPPPPPVLRKCSRLGGGPEFQREPFFCWPPAGQHQDAGMDAVGVIDFLFLYWLFYVKIYKMETNIK